jgi:soluble lytic murein transglycosylase-like protein
MTRLRHIRRLVALAFVVALACAAPASAQTPGPAPSPPGMPAVPYAAEIALAADTYVIDRLLMTALVRQESNFNPVVISRSGARGLTQLMPGTARLLGLRVDRRRRIDDRVIPALALDAGARYLRMQLDRFRSVRLALAAYNAGPGAVRRHRGIPPYRETRTYVRLVLLHRTAYRRELLLAVPPPADPETGGSRSR